MSNSLAILIGVTLGGGLMLSAFFVPVLSLVTQPVPVAAGCFGVAFIAACLMAAGK